MDDYALLAGQCPNQLVSFPAARHYLPPVVALGLVSLGMDISSEMVHGLLPVFLVGMLGAPIVDVGLI